jgi:hypothetical protein
MGSEKAPFNGASRDRVDRVDPNAEMGDGVIISSPPAEFDQEEQEYNPQAPRDRMEWEWLVHQVWIFLDLEIPDDPIYINLRKTWKPIAGQTKKQLGWDKFEITDIDDIKNEWLRLCDDPERRLFLSFLKAESLPNQIKLAVQARGKTPREAMQNAWLSGKKISTMLLNKFHLMASFSIGSLKVIDQYKFTPVPPFTPKLIHDGTPKDDTPHLIGPQSAEWGDMVNKTINVLFEKIEDLEKGANPKEKIIIHDDETRENVKDIREMTMSLDKRMDLNDKRMESMEGHLERAVNQITRLIDIIDEQR